MHLHGQIHPVCSLTIMTTRSDRSKGSLYGSSTALSLCIALTRPGHRPLAKSAGLKPEECSMTRHPDDKARTASLTCIFVIDKLAVTTQCLSTAYHSRPYAPPTGCARRMFTRSLLHDLFRVGNACMSNVLNVLRRGMVRGGMLVGFHLAPCDRHCSLIQTTCFTDAIMPMMS